MLGVPDAAGSYESVNCGGAANVETLVPLVASTAERSKTGEAVVIPAGGGALEGAIVTFTSDATLFGANVSVAAASGVVTVPPSVAETSVDGGDRPLDVFAVGSGALDGADAGSLAGGLAAGGAVSDAATTTVPAPPPAATVDSGAPPDTDGSGGVDTVGSESAEGTGVSTAGASVVDVGRTALTLTSEVAGTVAAGGSGVAIGGTVRSAGGSVTGAEVAALVMGVCAAGATVGAGLGADETGCDAGAVGGAGGGGATATGSTAACEAVSGAGIGSGRVSGAEIEGMATPVASSYVGSDESLLLAGAGCGRVT